MRVEQFVMAYGVEQDRVRALLPEGFESLRPVLRINSEIRNETEVYLELNAPVDFPLLGYTSIQRDLKASSTTSV